MLCKEVQLNLASGVPLDPAAAAHADSCAECSAMRDASATVTRSLQSWRADSAPATLWSGILDRTAKPAKQRIPWRTLTVKTAILATLIVPFVAFFAQNQDQNTLKPGEAAGHHVIVKTLRPGTNSLEVTQEFWVTSQATRVRELEQHTDVLTRKEGDELARYTWISDGSTARRIRTTVRPTRLDTPEGAMETHYMVNPIACDPGTFVGQVLQAEIGTAKGAKLEPGYGKDANDLIAYVPGSDVRLEMRENPDDPVIQQRHGKNFPGLFEARASKTINGKRTVYKTWEFKLIGADDKGLKPESLGFDR